MTLMNYYYALGLCEKHGYELVDGDLRIMHLTLPGRGTGALIDLERGIVYHLGHGGRSSLSALDASLREWKQNTAEESAE